jgi:hypothetical protein|nr:MAG TPA_asm: hypothetical protein [Caudoviricetes sp.]
MGQCFLYGNGVGSQLLYDVVCQTAEPAKKEGRIWIKSAVPMTYVEWNNNPWSGGAVGRVDIMGTLGGSNPTSSNNIIEVFNTKVSGIWNRMKFTPYRCQQVQGSTGNWVDVDAYVCHSNTWVHFWNGTLFDYGDQYTTITGGWTLSKFSVKDGAFDTGLTSQTSGNDVMACTGNKINVRTYKTLHIRCYSNYSSSGGRGGAKFGLCNSNGLSYDDFAAYKDIDTKSNTLTDYSVDISSMTGTYYVKFYASVAYMQGWLKIAKIWLT